ncbi:TLD domain-containing protein [Phthorimaea operculella]|nr:TLD domain-containing protein [Phthorimaea operculella]
MPVSVAWLLAGAAPPMYSRPTQPLPQHTGGLASKAWLTRLVCAVLVHWVPLYNSRDHGLGMNRFLHHTLAYRGPSMVIIQAQELVVVVCSSQEWRETHQYWGGPECCIIQLQPTFAVIEQAPKMLYLNTCIRGYPKGLRAGSDPRKPILIITEDFDTITFKGVPYALTNIEVWGCGDQASREIQLEHKKWQVREAERQRTVKLSAADWLDHPDRYLLEMAGRPQYNNSAS